MKKLYKSFEELIIASSFAEEGDFEAARQILKGQRRVLLAIREKSIGQRSILYAMNVCKRIGTGLDILLISQSEEDTSEEGTEDLKEIIKHIREEGIEVNVVKRVGKIREELLKYIKEKKNIEFIVIESGDNFKKEDRQNEFAYFWTQLKCPVVIVNG